MIDNSVLLNVTIGLSAVIATVAYAFFAYRFILRRRFERLHSAELIRKMLPVLIATFAATLTLTTFLWTRDEWRNLTNSIRSPSLNVEELGQRLKSLEDKVAALSAFSPRDSPSTQPQEPSEALAQLREAVKKNEQAIGQFEQLFLTDAERLITLPLLQRDVVAIRDDLSTTKESIAGLNRLLAESSGQNRWVIGTLALGMLALVVPAIRSLFPASSREDRRDRASAD